jgi:PRTRC genetic system protein E
MFTELTSLLKKGDTLVLNISLEGDNLFRVNVIPKLFTMDGKQGDDHKKLNQPLTVTGTAAELDSPEFAATLSRFTTSTVGLRQNIDEVEAAHKSATKTKPAAKAAEASASPEGQKKTSVTDRMRQDLKKKTEPEEPKEITESIL